jgi:hypothetical protein
VSDEKKFEPWSEFSTYVSTEIPVAYPPCMSCHFWRPRIKTDKFGDYDGVVLCTKIGDMQNDFSCYAKRLPTKEKA